MICKNIFLGLIFLLNSFSWAANASDSSLFQVSTKWKDENNKIFLLKNLEGKKVVMSMAYTSCQGTCPMIVSKLKKIEKLFNDKKIEVEVVIVSFDPGFDTPERHMSYYREKMGIKKENWHFLNGTDSEAREMSMLLGIKYAKNPESGVIIHDNKIVLINAKGEIQKRIEGLDEDEANLVN